MKQTILLLFIAMSLLISTQAQADSIPEFHAADQSRTFISQTGRVLSSGVIMFTLGGAFASVGGGDFLGLCAVGMGDIAEIEVSTAQIITNIFVSSQTFGTTALKFNLYQSDKIALKPSVALTLRSNTWAEVNRTSQDISFLSTAPDNVKGINTVDFEAHLTSLTLSSTAEFTPTLSGHAGIIWSEMRLRNIRYNQYSISVPVPPESIQRSYVGGSLALEYRVNPHTHSILEAGTVPHLIFNKEMTDVKFEPLYYGMAGIRFFFTPITSVDAGLRYRSDYSGLSDTEIRAGVNFGIDVFSSIKKKGIQI